MTLVDAALRQPTEARAGFVREACLGDDALHREVEERIEWELRMGGCLRDAVVATVEQADRPFEPGEEVSGRFRILREVGRGGMGVVYEAVDEKLDRSVALKCAQPGHRNRLPPEARAAREVSHYNVCKVYDLHSAQTPLGEVEFLTMEFIAGETLAQRLKRTGPLAPDEARGIAVQVCAGLAQAHRQGVIHGDLKCGNVILAETPDGGTRAVITDFGLAKLNDTGNSGGGTPVYMAPELFNGVAASAASDIYALGVMFHEMLTALPPAWDRPLPAIPEHGATVTLKKVPPAPDMRRRCATLPKPWGRVVARCLEPAAGARFGSADEIVADLSPRRTAVKWIASTAMLAAALAIALWQGRERPGAAVRLAVLPLQVEGAPIAAAAGIGVDVADRLSGLRRGFVVIPPAEAARNQVDTPQKAAAALGATHVLRTRLVDSGGPITASAWLIDTASGNVVKDLNGTYSRSDLQVLAKALTSTVTGAFHLSSGVPRETVKADAYPLYIQGMNLLRRDLISADEAIPLFEGAIAKDGASALPYAGLAEAQLQKVDRGAGPVWLDRAGRSVAKAQSLNPDSVPVLLAAGLFEQQHSSYEQASRDYSRATELAPNSADAWNRLGAVYGKMGRADLAVKAYRKALEAEPDYYANYLKFALFYFVRDQYSEAEALYRQVTRIAPNLYSGHMNLGLALMREGRLEEAERSLLRARELRETSRVLTNLGALYYQEERFGDAVPLFEAAAKAEPLNGQIYSNLGDAYGHLHRRREMLAAYRTAWDRTQEELTQNPRDAFTRANLALLSSYLGDRERAASEIAQALALAPDDGGVMRDAVFTFENLGQRRKALEVLAGAPPGLLQELSRQPDAKELARDDRFQALLHK